MTWYTLIDCGGFDFEIMSSRTEQGAQTLASSIQELSIYPITVRETVRNLKVSHVDGDIWVVAKRE